MIRLNLSDYSMGAGISQVFVHYILVLVSLSGLLFLLIHQYVDTMVITVCPGSSDPFYVVSYYIKWVTTSWTYSILDGNSEKNA